MRALVIGDHEILTTKIGEIISRSGLDYRTVDVARLASALDGASGIHHDLTVVVLPSDPERGVEVLGAIRNASPVDPLGRRPNQRCEAGPSSAPAGRRRVSGSGRIGNRTHGQPGAATGPSGSRRPTTAASWVCWRQPAAAGASTLAANLAVLLAKWCGQAALIDMRAAASDLAGLLDVKPDTRPGRPLPQCQPARCQHVPAVAGPPFERRSLVGRSQQVRRSRTSHAARRARGADPRPNPVPLRGARPRPVAAFGAVGRPFSRPISCCWCCGSTSRRCAMPGECSII